MQYREKSAWICLVTTLMIFIPYFGHVFQLFVGDALTAPALTNYCVTAVFGQAALNVGVHIMVSVRYRCEKKDERDSAIESRSFHAAYWIMSALVWGLIFLVPMRLAQGRELTPLFISQLLLLAFVLSEVGKFTTQIVSYRRGY